MARFGLAPPSSILFFHKHQRIQHIYHIKTGLLKRVGTFRTGLQSAKAFHTYLPSTHSS